MTFVIKLDFFSDHYPNFSEMRLIVMDSDSDGYA